MQPAARAARRAGGVADEIGVLPDGCAAFQLTDRQCEHIVDRLGASVNVEQEDQVEYPRPGDPGCGADVGPNVICARTTSFIVRVRFIRDDGRALEDSQFCGVFGEHDLGCTDPPTLQLSAPTLSGYTDIPCSGDPPDGCASPVPTIDPAVAKDGRPLAIASRDVPLDHVGHYDIPLGTAVLPNGVLTEGSFAVAEDAQTDFLRAGGQRRAASGVRSGPQADLQRLPAGVAPGHGDGGRAPGVRRRVRRSRRDPRGAGRRRPLTRITRGRRGVQLLAVASSRRSSAKRGSSPSSGLSVGFPTPVAMRLRRLSLT